MSYFSDAGRTGKTEGTFQEEAFVPTHQQRLWSH